MSSRQAQTPASLITACRAGNRHAQFELYQRYAKAMLNTSYRIVNQREDAEDVLQEAFVKAFNKLHLYRGDASFGAWLKRIVINTAVSFLQRKKTLFREWIDEAGEVPESTETDWDEDIKLARAYKALHQLPDGYRTVFSLYVLEGYDHAEIGEILGISPSTSISQLSRAKQKLRLFMTKMPSHG